MAWHRAFFMNLYRYAVVVAFVVLVTGLFVWRMMAAILSSGTLRTSSVAETAFPENSVKLWAMFTLEAVYAELTNNAPGRAEIAASGSNL